MAAARVAFGENTVGTSDRFTVKFTKKFASAAYRVIVLNASLPNLLPIPPSFPFYLIIKDIKDLFR